MQLVRSGFSLKNGPPEHGDRSNATVTECIHCSTYFMDVDGISVILSYIS